MTEPSAELRSLSLRAAAAVGIGAVVLLGLSQLLWRWWDEAERGQVLAAADARWLLAALLCFILGQLGLGPRFQAMLPPEAPRLRLPQASGLFYAAQGFNLALPGPLGELLPLLVMKRRLGLSMQQGLASSLYARLSGLLLSALCCLPAFFLLDESSSALQRGLLIALCALALGAGSLGVIASRPPLFMSLTRAVLRQLRGLPGSQHLQRAILSLIGSLGETFELPRSSWMRMWLLSAGIQLAHGLVLLCCTQAFGWEVSWSLLLLAQGLSTMLLFVSFLIPGGLGSFELAILTVFSGLHGLSLEAGLMLVLVLRGIQLLGLGSSALLLLIWAGRALLPELDNARRWLQESERS